jgi:hypothetical protein
MGCAAAYGLLSAKKRAADRQSAAGKAVHHVHATTSTT